MSLLVPRKHGYGVWCGRLLPAQLQVSESIVPMPDHGCEA